MHTHAEPPNLSYREPLQGRADVTPRRLLQRQHLAAGVCQECTRAPLAWALDESGEPFQRVLCASCRDRQNAARRERARQAEEAAS